MTQTNSTGLFRQQAMKHQQYQLHGEVVLLPKMSIQALTTILLVWVIAAFIWLTNNHYVQQETVRGWLEPSGGIAKSYASDIGGTVHELWVSEGQMVRQGEPLLSVRNQRFLASGKNVEQTLINEYINQQAQIQQQQSSAVAIAQLERQSQQQQINNARIDLVHLEQQIDTLKKRITLVERRMQKTSSMRSVGHASDIDLENLEEQRLVLQTEFQRTQRAQLKQQAHLESLVSELALNPEHLAQRQAVLALQHSELEQLKAQLNSQSDYTLVASRSGTVSNIQVQPGQTIQQQQPLLSILPQDAVIEANLLVPISAAGFLTAGQTIDIRYDAFPYQKFGLYQGVIASITHNVLLPNEVSDVPLPFSEPMYLVKAQLARSNIDANGERVDLKPGMTFSADIAISERSLMEWLLAPLYSLRGRL